MSRLTIANRLKKYADVWYIELWKSDYNEWQTWYGFCSFEFDKVFNFLMYGFEN